jgi:hypothetical protein
MLWPLDLLLEDNVQILSFFSCSFMDDESVASCNL